MANIQEHVAKDGTVSYRIRVHRGRDAQGRQLNPFQMTWTPEPKMTKRQIEKELQKQAAIFEEQCKQGLIGDGSQRFDAYAEYVLDLRIKSGEVRHHTAVRYKELLKRINAGIGHMKLKDIRPQHLNQLYDQLSQDGIRRNKTKAILKDADKLRELIAAHGWKKEQFAKEIVHISFSTFKQAERLAKVEIATADKIAAALGVSTESLFTIEQDNTPLSPKTVREHHRVIHMVLHQAEREMLIPYNPASKATPPKTIKPNPDYFQPNEIADILQAAENEPLKWKTLLHLLLVTGGRRGEVLGLTWDNINFTFSTITIEKTLNYETDSGYYIDRPKTQTSSRFLKLPPQTMELLKQYRDEYYQPLKAVSGDTWDNRDFLFVQDSGKRIGSPMHPDSITQYCGLFSDKYDLPHIHPHAFRHTAASVLYFAGMDIVSISNHLGHASPSTTQNIYSHMIQESKSRAADAMGQLILKSTEKPSEDKPQKKHTAG